MRRPPLMPVAVASSLAAAVAGCDCEGEVRVAPPVVQVQPRSVDLGGIPLGESTDARIEVRSVGGSTLTVAEVALSSPVENDELELRDVLAQDCQGNARAAPLERLPPGACARFTLRFTPRQARTMQRTVRVVTDDPARETVEVMVFGEGLAPAAALCAVDGEACAQFDEAALVDFGAVARGSSTTRTLRVANTGRAPLVIESAALETGSAGYSLPAVPLAPEIPPEASADLKITFAPAQKGPHAGRLVLLTNDPERGRIVVELRGEGLVPAVRACGLAADGSVDETACVSDAATERVVDFGALPRRSAAARTVRVFNTGGAPLVLSGAALEAGADAFRLPAEPFVPVVAPGAHADVEVVFAPAAKGTYQGRLRLDSDDPEDPKVRLALRGEGTAPSIRVCAEGDGGSFDATACSRLDDAPAFVPTVALPPTALGSRSTRAIRIINTGAAPLLVSAAAVTAGAPEITLATPGLPATLAAGGSLDVQVQASPSREGELAGTVRIESDDDAHPAVQVPVAGSGVAPALRVCVLRTDGSEDSAACSRLRADPPFVPTLDFGHVPWFQQRTRVLRLSNIGAAPMTLSAPQLVTAATTDFSLGTGAAATTLAVGTTHDLEVRFAPQSEGALTAEVRLGSNDPQSPAVTVPVKAFADGPQLCVEPQSVDFGTVAVGMTGTRRVTVRNCGQVGWNLAALELTETDATTLEFARSGAPALPKTLAPGEEAGVDIVYTPRAQRDDLGTLVARSQFGSASVALKGRGGPPSCQAQPALADAGADRTVRPLDTIVLDGSRSSSPRAGALRYSWSLVAWPQNSRTDLVIPTADPAKPKLWALLAGDYTVQLVVTDASNCQSAPDTMVVHVVPDKRIHLQLTWAQNHGDLDLHYMRPGAAFYSKPGDVYWDNAAPDWGLGANNPTHDIDRTWGLGPENVNQGSANDGSYPVNVHYYCARNNCRIECVEILPFICMDMLVCDPTQGSATATLKLYVDGVEKTRLSRTLYQRDVWRALTVNVSGGGTRIDFTPNNTVTLDNKQACTEDTY